MILDSIAAAQPYLLAAKYWTFCPAANKYIMYEYASSVHIIEKISRDENVEDGASASLGDAASDISV